LDPLINETVLLSNTHLVLEPHLDRRGWCQLAHDLRDHSGKVFLNAAMARRILRRVPGSSADHRCLKRHGIRRLPEIASDKTSKKPFKRYPIGYFHIDIAEVRTEEGRLYLFVAIDRTSKLAFAELHETVSVKAAVGCL
jgi:hypothetical protein